MREKWSGGLAWAGALTAAAACLGPVWQDWSGAVVAPFGGIDAMLQLGILEWTARHWTEPSVWLDLPIFFPVAGALGFMDSLLGQAWLVLPLHALGDPTVAALYNSAFLGSLLLAVAGAACVWLAAGGGRWSAGVMALALVGAPYTQAQIGHLNQLPPPFVLFTIAAALLALRRRDAGRPAGSAWWFVGLALVLQAAWGWYGFAHAVIAVAVIKVVWLVRGLRRGQNVVDLAWPVIRQALLPAVLTVGAVLLLAQPQLQLRERYESFTRETVEVRIGSADIQHLFNRGTYRGEPADWIGRGKTGFARYDGRARQVLNPGWVALVLGLIGWLTRRRLGDGQRSAGTALLALGLVGLVLAFGESVGLPGTDRRLPLPLEWLRQIAPPFRAFRGAWRFSWLMVIAIAWWSAVGVSYLAALKGRRRHLAPLAVALLVLVSLPGEVPVLKVPLSGRLAAAAADHPGPIVTLPAPATEYVEDVAEALLLARSLETGQPVSGGVTGWVPPEIVAFRTRLKACEDGLVAPPVLLAEWKQAGFVTAEITLRPGDQRRIGFWRNVLLTAGAVRSEPWPRPGFEMYRLP